MKFQTEWDRKREFTPNGDKFLPQYVEAIDKKGKTYLKRIKDKDVYEEIQEQTKGVDTYEIIDKYLQTGDESLLNKRKGIYADFTNMPKSPNEIFQKIVEAEKKFNQLDRETRALFDNDVGVFKQSIIDGTFEDKVAHFIGEKTKAEKAELLKKQVEEEKKSE